MKVSATSIARARQPYRCAVIPMRMYPPSKTASKGKATPFTAPRPLASYLSTQAAEKLRRKCFALEIQPAFVDVAVRRWQQASGKEATLNGTTFSKIEEQRR